MFRTPGFLVPSSTTSSEDFAKNLRRIGKASGYTPFNITDYDEAFEHFGIKGMHWGRTNTDVSSPTSLRDQAVMGLRHDAGKIAAHQVLKNYGHLALPAAKGAVKSTATVLRYSATAAKGAATAVKILAVVGKYSFRFGKAYGRNAVKLAKLGR